MQVLIQGVWAGAREPASAPSSAEGARTTLGSMGGEPRYTCVESGSLLAARGTICDAEQSFQCL